MTDILTRFKKCETGVSELKHQFGDDLHNVLINCPETVNAADVICAIEKFLNNTISQQELADWVNIIWFTDLFAYIENEENAIASAMILFETLDEEDVCFTKDDYLQMIDDLKHNQECD